METPTTVERPAKSKPRLAEWHNDDEQLSVLLDHIDKKVLNINTWSFNMDHMNKSVTYDEIIKNIRAKYPAPEWIEVLKQLTYALPRQHDLIKKELFTVFKRFTLNLQERLGYIQELEKYSDHLEEQLGLEKENAKRDFDKVMGELKKLNERFDGFCAEKIVPLKPIEQLQAPEKPGAKEILDGAEISQEELVQEATDAEDPEDDEDEEPEEDAEDPELSEISQDAECKFCGHPRKYHNDTANAACEVNGCGCKKFLVMNYKDDQQAEEPEKAFSYDAELKKMKGEKK